MIFKKSLHPCALDERSLCIGRVKPLDYWGMPLHEYVHFINYGTDKVLEVPDGFFHRSVVVSGSIKFPHSLPGLKLRLIYLMAKVMFFLGSVVSL